MYYTPLFYKCIMFFLLFYTFVAFTVLPTKILALFVNLTLKQNALFRAIFNLPQFFWLFLLPSKIFSVFRLSRHNRPIFLRRARKNVSLPVHRQPPRLPAVRVHCVHPWTPSIFPAFFAPSVFCQSRLVPPFTYLLSPCKYYHHNLCKEHSDSGRRSKYESNRHCTPYR